MLGPHGPDAVLASLIFVGVLGGAIYFGFMPCAAFGLGLFFMYGVRKHLHERHMERMASADIAKRQMAIEEFCARQQVKLRKKGQKASEQSASRSRR